MRGTHSSIAALTGITVLASMSIFADGLPNARPAATADAATSVLVTIAGTITTWMAACGSSIAISAS